MNTHVTKRQGRPRQSTTIAVSIPPEHGVHLSDTQIQPEFVRLPKSGHRCPWTGLSRASLNELILGSGAPVKSVVLRREGASRGIRLLLLSSLLDHLHQQMAQQTSDQATEEGGAS